MGKPQNFFCRMLLKVCIIRDGRTWTAGTASGKVLISLQWGIANIVSHQQTWVSRLRIWLGCGWAWSISKRFPALRSVVRCRVRAWLHVSILVNKWTRSPTWFHQAAASPRVYAKSNSVLITMLVSVWPLNLEPMIIPIANQVKPTNASSQLERKTVEVEAVCIVNIYTLVGAKVGLRLRLGSGRRWWLEGRRWNGSVAGPRIWGVWSRMRMRKITEAIATRTDVGLYNAAAWWPHKGRLQLQIF